MRPHQKPIRRTNRSIRLQAIVFHARVGQENGDSNTKLGEAMSSDVRSGNLRSFACFLVA